MKNCEQELVNRIVYHNMENCLNQGMQYIGRLRQCRAEVWATDDYYVLRSYNTVIACIDSKGICYDFLRFVYGYTATSAQHIRKFMREYNATQKLTYKEINLI